MISDQIKVKLISVGNTFITSFILGVGATLYTMGTVEWTATFWISLLIAGARAGIVAITASLVPQRLGGRANY